LVALLGFATAVLPAIASSETSPSISAYNEPGAYGYSNHSWMPSTAMILSGGVVKFSNPSSEVPHGLKFTGGPATPACSAIPVAATEASGATNWHGECTFSTPGTYTFICTVHPTEMKGTITVNASGTTTTTTTTPVPTPTTPTAPVEPSSGSPLTGSPSLRASQRGSTVKGSLDISKAGAGDRLEIDVFAQSASLAKSGHSRRVRVGRLIRGSVPAGELPFAVKLNAGARSTLKRHHRLGLAVRIMLTPLHGESTTLTRSVVEHG
jgi:plastocyanin